MYRDDLAAAHARIRALEEDIDRIVAAYMNLKRRYEELESGKATATFSEERLREQMRREEAEVKAKVRAMRGG